MGDAFYAYYPLFFYKESTTLSLLVQAGINLTMLVYLYQLPKNKASSAIRCSIKLWSVLAAKMTSSAHNKNFNITMIFSPSSLSH